MIFPVRMRRRLTVAFILVAVVSAAMLATGSYFLVRHHRVRATVDQALRITRLNLKIAPRQFDQAQLNDALDYYRRWTGVDALVVQADHVYSSRDVLGPKSVPPALREAVASGELAHRRTEIGGVPYLVTGAQVDGSGTQMYFFFSMRGLFDGLLLLRNVLAVGCLGVTLLAAIVGYGIARRTLEPVRVAAEAARLLAEGLLDTRLAVATKDEFGAWARYFNEMADALEEKIRVLEAAHARERQFTGDVAHELRTPLSALVASASMLSEGMADLPPELRRPAELTVRGVTRLRRVTEDLLELSRLDARSEPLVVDQVDLGDSISSTVSGNGWGRIVDVQCEPVVVDTDRTSLDRIIGNLIDNAVRHAGRGVRVRVGRDGRDAVVEVSDEGPGIPAEHLPAIFNRFHKVDSSRTTTGSGLGLAIAKENAERLDARLEVTSTVGVGTTFVLRLPARIDHEREEAATGLDPEHAVVRAPSQR